jgi:hypothetical protein
MVTQESIQTQILQRLLQIEKTQVEGFVERVPDVPRIIIARDKVYTFTRMTSLGTQMLNSTVSPIVFSNAPSLASVPFSAEFSTLFESWRIVQATWLFTPLFAGAVANPYIPGSIQMTIPCPLGRLKLRNLKHCVYRVHPLSLKGPSLPEFPWEVRPMVLSPPGM